LLLPLLLLLLPLCRIGLLALEGAFENEEELSSSFWTPPAVSGTGRPCASKR
jgi:hypothetical protein